MKEKINLRVNYPVLEEQAQLFKKTLDPFYARYNDWLGLHAFNGNSADREAAAEWISGTGQKISADRIAIVTGGHHACLVSVIAASLQGEAIAVEEFSYPGFADIAKMMNVRLVPCAVDEHGMIPSALQAASEKHDIKGIYLMPTVCNPSGVVMPLARRLEIIEMARAYGQIIIDDDAYGFIEDTPPPNFAQLAPDLGWYIYSLSKPLAPDIKVAFIAAPEKDMGQINNAIKLTTSNPSSFFTSLITEMIHNGDLAALISQKRSIGKQRQSVVREFLKGQEIQAHQNSWHLWLRLPGKIKADELNKKLLAEGVEVLSGSLFAAPGAVVNEHIRIALGAEKDMDKIMRGIKIIRDQLDNWDQ